jgi:hypothetical protein
MENWQLRIGHWLSRLALDKAEKCTLARHALSFLLAILAGRLVFITTQTINIP